MWRKLFDRTKEPSSYGGVAAIALGLGEIFKVREAQQVAEVASQAGEAVAAGAPPYVGIAALLAGVVSVFAPERHR